MSLLSQPSNTNKADPAQSFGTQDARIVSAIPKKSSKYVETEYGTQTPKLDAFGKTIPKVDLEVTFAGDDGKVVKAWYSGLKAEADGNYSMTSSLKNAARRFLVQVCEFTQTNPDTLQGFNDIVGKRLRVMGVPPGTGTRWKILPVGPAQLAVAPVAVASAAPVAVAPAKPVVPVDGAAAYAALDADTREFLASNVAKSGVEKAARMLVGADIVRDIETATAIAQHAKTLGA